MNTKLAACSCGKLSLTARGEPVRISVCHCLSCQRRTGSTFGAQARFPSHNVSISGQSQSYCRIGDSGDEIVFQFCSNCGSTLYYELNAVPGVIAVPIGAFADPDFPAPTVSVYESRMHSWTGLPHGIKHYDT